MRDEKGWEILQGRMANQWKQEQEDREKRKRQQETQDARRSAYGPANTPDGLKQATSFGTFERNLAFDAGNQFQRDIGYYGFTPRASDKSKTGPIGYNPYEYAVSKSKEYREAANELQAASDRVIPSSLDFASKETIYDQLIKLGESEDWPSELPKPTSQDFEWYAEKYDTLPDRFKSKSADEAVALYNQPGISRASTKKQYDYKSGLQSLANQYSDQSTMHEGLAEFFQIPEDERDHILNYTIAKQGQKSASINLGRNPQKDAIADYYKRTGMRDDEASEKAERVYNALNRAQNQYKSQGWEEAFSDFQEEHPVLSNVASIPINFVGGITSGITAGYDAVQGMTGKQSEYKNRDKNLPGYQYERAASVIRSQTKEDILGDNPNLLNKTLAALYGGSMSAADNLLRVSTLGGTGSLAMAGFSSFGSGYQEAVERGASPAEAFLYGGINGALEILTEKVSIDRFLEASSRNTLKEITKDALKQGLVEVSEEEASFWAGLLADALIMGDRSEYNSNVSLYMLEGYTEQEARKMASKQIMQDAWDTAVESFISGGLMSGASSAKQYIGYGNQGGKLSDTQKQSLLMQAERMPGTESSRMAVRGGINSNNAYFGNLQEQLQADIADRITGGETAEELFNLYRDSIAETTPKVQATADIAFMNRARELWQDVGNSAEFYATGEQVARQNSENTGESWVDLVLRRKSTSESTINRILTDDGFRQEFQEKTGVEVPEVSLKGKGLKGKGRSSLTDITQAKRIVTSAIMNDEQRTQAYKDVYKNTSSLAQEEAAEAQAGDLEEHPLGSISKENVSTPLPYTVGARIASSGENVDITGIKFRGGQLVAETSGGDFTLPELSVSAGDKMGQVLNIAAGYGGNIARNFLSNYDGGTDPKTYRDAYNAFLTAGRIAASAESFTFERAAAVNDAYARVLPVRAQMEAFSVGKEAAKAENAAAKATTQKAQKGRGTVEDKTTAKLPEQDSMVKLLSMYAKRTGINVTILDSIRKGDAKANGSFVAGTMSMYLSSEADNLLQALGHESGEFISAFAPEEKAALRDSFLKWWAYHENLNSVDRLIRKYQERYSQAEDSKTYNQAADEAINDAIGALLTTEAGQKQFVDWISRDSTTSTKEKKSVVLRIKNAIQKILDGLKSYLNRKGVSQETRRFLKMEASQQEKVMKQFFHALDAAVENARETGEYVEEISEESAHQSANPVYALSPTGDEVKEIKQQIRTNQEKLNNMTPVANLNIPNKNWNNQSQNRKWAVEQLKSTGYAVERSGFGKIIFDEKHINSSLNYLDTPGEIAAFAAIPRVLKRGIEIGRHENHKGRDYGTVTIGAPITINGKTGNMAIVVKITNKNYYKTHRILMPDGSAYEFQDTKDAEPKPAGALSIKDTHATPISSASVFSVPQQGNDVNQKYSLSFEEESELLLAMGETEESREEQWRSSFAEGAEARTRYQMIEAESEAAMEELARTARGISTMEERLATQEALQRVSSATQDMVEYWRSQTKPHKGKTFQEASGKIARELKNSYQSQMNVNELSRGLQEVYNTLYSKGYESAVEKAVELSKKLISKSVDTSGSLYEDYADARKYFRDKTVTISAEDAHDIPDFRDFQKRNFGRLKIGISYNRQQATIDGDFAEMAEMMPGFLDTTNTLAASDKLLAVAEALDAIYADRGVNPYEGSISETVNESALEMIQRMTGEFAEETFADKQAKAMQEAVEAAKTEAQGEMQKLREEAKRASLEADRTIAQLRNSARAERMDARINLNAAEKTAQELRKQLAKSEERFTKQLAKSEERRLADAMYYGRKAQERLTKQLDKAEEQIQKAKDKLQKYRADRDERDERTRLRASVERKSKRLISMIVKNDAKTHMPEPFKKTVGDFLLSLDFDSKRLREGGKPTAMDRSYTDSLARMKNALANQAKYLSGEETENGVDIYIDLPSGFLDVIQKHIEDVQKATELIVPGTSQVYEMDARQLRILDEILTTVSTSIANANVMLADAAGKTVSEYSESSIKGMDEIGPKSKRTGKTSDFLKWDNATPYYAFQRFFQGGNKVFDGLARGWDKMAMNVKRVLDFSNSAYTDKEVKEWSSEVHEVKLSSGKTVKMTTAQIMSFYCLANREHSMDHLMGGGIRPDNFKIGGKTISQVDPFLISMEDLPKITKKLTTRQMEVANKIQKFMSTVGSKWGNEISMKRFGTLQFTEENYFPIASDTTNLPARDPGAMENSMFRLLNLSMTKSLTPNANNAIVVSNIFDVFSNHMADMAKYNALALPILDAMKWYNYKETTTTADGKITTRTVQRSMEKAYGRAANQYFTTFVKDLNGMSEGGRGEGLANKMISNYKMAAVGANLRVAILQPTAYVRAMAVISPRYLVRAFSMKNGYKEMLQYSGIAVWKDMGFYDTNIGRGIREQIKGETTFKEKAAEKLMFLAELGDKLTWGRLWNACKLETKEGTGLRGEALNQATANRFRDVIYATQVVDSTMTRSQIMRSKSTMSKMLTAFMSEPTISYNILMNAHDQFMTEARRTGDKGKAWRLTKGAIMVGFTAYSVNAVASALAESFWDAFRDDDEYESLYDKFLQALFGWDGNLAQDLFPFSKIPYLKDITSILTGYDIDRMDMESFKNLYDAYRILAEKFLLKTGKLDKPTSITYYGKMTDYGAISKCLKALSQAIGLPGYSLTRDVVTIWNNTAGVFTGDKIRTYEPSSETAIQEAFEAGYLTREEALEKLQEKVTDKDGNAISQDDAYWKLRSWETGSSSKIHTLTGSLIAGKADGIQEAKQELLSHGYTEDDMDSLFTKAIGNAYTKDADGNYGNGRISRKQAEKYLRTYTEKSDKDVYEQLQKWDYAVDNEGTEGFSVYNDLYSAIDAGSSLDDAKQALVSGGYAEKDIDKQIKSRIGDLYKSGDISRTEAEKRMKNYLGVDDGKELYDIFREWDYASENGSSDGFTQYMDVDTAIEAGKPIDSYIRELTANGYKEDDIRNHAVSYVGQLFRDGEITETKAGQLYVKYANLDEDGNKPDENDVYWKLKEWKYKKANPDAESYSRYDTLFASIDSGRNLSASLQEFLDHGYEGKDISGTITRQYKKQFVKLWNSNRIQAEALMEKLLDAYEALGYSRSKKRNDILDWLEES